VSDPRAAEEQRAREVLAAYAQAPPGEKFGLFLDRVAVSRPTWGNWLRQWPWFRQDFSDVQEERARIDLEPLREHLQGVASALVHRALDGDVPAIRTVFELTGHLKSGGPSVRVQQVVQGGAATSITVESMEGLLAEHAELGDLILRRVQGLRALPEDSGDPGPAPDAEGPEPGPAAIP